MHIKRTKASQKEKETERESSAARQRKKAKESKKEHRQKEEILEKEDKAGRYSYGERHGSVQPKARASIKWTKDNMAATTSTITLSMEGVGEAYEHFP